MVNSYFSLLALATSLGIDLDDALHNAIVKYETRLATKGRAGSG